MNWNLAAFKIWKDRVGELYEQKTQEDGAGWKSDCFKTTEGINEAEWNNGSGCNSRQADKYEEGDH